MLTQVIESLAVCAVLVAVLSPILAVFVIIGRGPKDPTR